MPVTTTEPKFNCSSCGKEYRWKPELAGKKAKCKCGSVIAVPLKQPAAPRPAPKPAEQDADLDGLYALAQEKKKATVRSADVADSGAGGYRCTSCAATAAGAVSVPIVSSTCALGSSPCRAVGGGGAVIAECEYLNAKPPARRAGVLPTAAVAAALPHAERASPNMITRAASSAASTCDRPDRARLLF